jgi:murein DD-endopeptidase MepM/ murein hydrolase activator NlpD
MKFKATKDRKNQLPIFRSFLLFFCIGVWWLFCSTLWSGGASSNGSSASDQAGKIFSSLSIEKYKELISYVVKPGDTFLGILSHYGVPRNTAINCFRSLNPLGLMSLIPGDSLIMTRYNNDSMTALSLLHKLDCWYTISLNGPKITVDKKPVMTSSQRCIVRGVLETSLSEDMNKMGVDDACVSKFADIFGWDINFFVDPQKGDSFEIIFEKKFAEGRFAGYGEIFAARYVNAGHAFNAIGIRDEKGARDIRRYYDLDGKSLQKQFLKAPLRFSHISSGYSLHRLHPVLGIVRPHLGVDYAAPTGTPVYAAADGVITFAGFMGGFGNHVKIRHGASYETYYGHLHAIARGIRPGARVSQGDFLGTVGATGIATGPHLDYRMSINQRFVNPLKVSLPSEKGISVQDMAQFTALKREWCAVLGMRFKGLTGFYVLDFDESRPAPQDKALTSNQELRPNGDRLPPS